MTEADMATTDENWRVRKSGVKSGPRFVVWAAPTGRVASVYGTNAEATANLIAAAPELLAVLEAADHALSVHGKIDGGTPLHERISAIIDITKGPQS
jgi:hypothetical protein